MYYADNQTQTRDFDEEEILSELPLSLRTEVLFKMTRWVMKKLSIFATVEDSILRKIAARLIPVHLPPGLNSRRHSFP